MGKRRKPSRLFWLWTFAIGIYSPDKGQRRVAADRVADRKYIEELEARNSRLETDKGILMEQLANSVARGNDLQSRLEIAAGVHELDKVKGVAEHDPATIILSVGTPWGTTDPAVIKAMPEGANDHFSESLKAS